MQAAVEAALGFVADHPVAVTCAGRTDTGVHAIGQVLHFDTSSVREQRSWVLGANARLPGDIALRWAREVPDEFHARFSAIQRSYRYFIALEPTRPALLQGRVCWWHQSLDVDAMAQAAQVLLGEHDFSAFRSSECQARSAVRRVDSLSLQRVGRRVTIEISANAFLHHMVRNVVGTLLKVGSGEQGAAWVAEVLAGRNRKQAGVTAPAAGLYLWKVTYPQDAGLPALPDAEPWAMIGSC